MPRKKSPPVKVKSQVIRCKIQPKSDEEVALNYLTMQNKSLSKKTITLEDFFNLAPARFKEQSRAQKALTNLVLYKYAQVDDFGNYEITALGYQIPYILAQHRRNKNVRLSDED